MEADLQQGGVYALLEYSVNFADVQQTHWAANTIRVLAAKHLVNGVSESEYQPNRMMTRAEFVQLAAAALNLKDKGELSFNDVTVGAWYEDALSKMVKAGLVSGRSADRFEPNAMISRQELVIILMRAYKLQNGTEPSTGGVSFNDEASIAPWARESVQAASALGLVNGRSGGRFAPNDSATRAETAQFILNYLK
ncbi:S-layer homology domain-containing protein [Cohnella faecalis]|uniref:S-layer homology domain-containing protein n=2 Tax=Cohnella faecalis TaxID=2315694 RepID=A0A398CFK6_9BACL|nr:S-layer homology domain-containing protein [Cohnella faecalis]RIE00682.1 S-layer homology domain-containing protein [Cohnella faecalis]